MGKKLAVLNTRNTLSKGSLKSVKVHPVQLKDYPELSLFSFYEGKTWWIIEKSTGLAIVNPHQQNCSSLEFAIAAAHENIHKFGVPYFENAIADAIKRYGVANP
jgi:hypothetical protein